MEKLILIVHVLTAVAIIGLILLQQGKGAEMGASFGAGASQTVFGSQGSGNFFTRTTAIFATIFFVTSFGLAIVAKQNASVVDTGIPALEESREMPVEINEGSDIPSVDPQRDDTGGDIPTVDNSLGNDGTSDIPSVDSVDSVDPQVPTSEGESTNETSQ